MNFNEIVSVSKMGGLYLIHKKRNDGLIIKSLQDDKVLFAASRSHVFTPLENITVYTQTDSIELINVFKAINTFKAKSTIPSPKDSNSSLKEFFGKIVPDYDDEKVYVSDIQKIIKWFVLLDEKGISWNDEIKKNETVSEEENLIKEAVVKKITKKTTKKVEESSEDKPAKKVTPKTKKTKE